MGKGVGDFSGEGAHCVDAEIIVSAAVQLLLNFYAHVVAVRMDDGQQAFILPLGGHLIQQAIAIVLLVGAPALLQLFEALGSQLSLSILKGHTGDNGLVCCSVTQGKRRSVVSSARQHPVFFGVNGFHQGFIIGAVILAIHFTAGRHRNHAGGIFQHKAAETAVDPQIRFPVAVQHCQVAAAAEQFRHAKNPGSKGIPHSLQCERNIRRLADDTLLFRCRVHPVECITDHLGSTYNVK